MDLKSKKIKQKLIAKRRDVRNKLDLLRHGEFVRENMFSPITKHLKNIEDKLNKKSPEKENPASMSISENSSSSVFNPDPPSEYHEFEDMQSAQSTPEKKKHVKEAADTGEEPHGSKLAIIHELESEEESEKKANLSRSKAILNKSVPAVLQKSYGQDITDDSFQDYLGQYEPLPRYYIKAMLSSDTSKSEFDLKYGVRHNAETEKFFIGDSQLKIDGADIIVKNKRYRGTRGLYELLFKKSPKYYSQADERAYKDIVLKTNAHRRYYQPSQQVDGSRLDKYKKIISQIGIVDKDGGGMFMEVSGNQIDYVHWDDPNELVDRLRLLLASKQAGHSGHTNELISIVEELREAKIIE